MDDLLVPVHRPYDSKHLRERIVLYVVKGWSCSNIIATELGSST